MSVASFPLSAKPVIPVLTSDTTLATAGYFQLSWQPGINVVSDKSLQYELQQADNAMFADARIVYVGTDLASVISGKQDGKYYYRIRSLGENQELTWSNPVVVEVRHHALSKALGFFAIGALVFLATLAFIMNGTKQVRQG